MQFEKHEYPWGNVTFAEVAGLQHATSLELTLLHCCFSRILNFENASTLRTASHFYQLAKFHEQIVYGSRLFKNVPFCALMLVMA